MKALHIWLFPIHSLDNVGHYSPLPLGPNVLASTLPVGDQALIPFYHDPTFHPILSGLRLQWCTHSPPTGLNFASLLAYALKKKTLIVLLCKPSINGSSPLTLRVMWNTTVHPFGAQRPCWHTSGRRSGSDTILSWPHLSPNIVQFKVIVAHTWPTSRP